MSWRAGFTGPKTCESVAQPYRWVVCNDHLWSAVMRRTGLLAATLGVCNALTAYQRLTGATVLSVADRRPVELTSTWQGNDRVVVEFLRHFG